MIPEEQGLIKVSSGLLSALSSGQLNIDVFKKEILALECMVARTSFRKLDTIESGLAATVKLDIKREGKNEFDKFAVALYYKTVKVGYIPKDKNEVEIRHALSLHPPGLISGGAMVTKHFSGYKRNR